MEFEGHSLRQRPAQIINATLNRFTGTNDRMHQRLERSSSLWCIPSFSGTSCTKFHIQLRHKGQGIHEKEKNYSASNSARKLPKNTRVTHQLALSYEWGYKRHTLLGSRTCTACFWATKHPEPVGIKSSQRRNQHGSRNRTPVPIRHNQRPFIQLNR